MAKIIITGSPCTGKTTLARIICRHGYHKIDVAELIKKEKLCESIDKDRDCIVVDEIKLAKAVENKIKDIKNVVIDSHLSHYVNPKKVDLCIVCVCKLRELEKRLQDRKYHKQKIRENLDAEIFDTCYNEALELGHKVIKFDTTKGIDEKKVEEILNEAS